MKKIFLVLFGILVFSGCGKPDLGYDYDYVTKFDGVYYKEMKIDEVDSATFQALGGFYAKDKNNVYDHGHKLEGIDPESFQVLDDNSYFKDKNNVFYYNDTPEEPVKLENADPETFEVLDGYEFYSRDKKHCYKDGEIVDNSECDVVSLYYNIYIKEILYGAVSSKEDKDLLAINNKFVTDNFIQNYNSELYHDPILCAQDYPSEYKDVNVKFLVQDENSAKVIVKVNEKWADINIDLIKAGHSWKIDKIICSE